jgi:hypothetical protein
MDSTLPYLRTQTELLTEAKVKTKLASTNRWSDVEYYTALNEILMSWADKVQLPRVYTITAGFLASEFEYDLPSYIRPPIYPELLRRLPYREYMVESSTSRWQEVTGFDVSPNSTGGLTLRIYAPPRTGEAQIVWYAPNSRVPTNLPVTSGSTAADATTVLISTAIDIDDTGYVKIDAEYMSYSGVTRGASTTTLLNVVRDLHGSAAAVHNTGATVTWCVAFDDVRLMQQLFNQWRSYMPAYMLQDGGVHETERYEKQMSFYEQQAANFWATYKPHRRTSGMSLSSKALVLRG